MTESKSSRERLASLDPIRDAQSGHGSLLPATDGATNVSGSDKTKPFGAKRTAILVGVALIIAAVLVPTYAYPRMFTTFRNYDDEGYMLTSLRGYMAGGALYDNVFTQYGPAYFQLTSPAFRAFGADAVPDNGRLFTMILWLLTAAMVGVTTGILTRSLTLGLLSELLAFMILRVAVYEPLHPGGLLSFLIAAMVLVAAWGLPRFPRFAFGTIGALVAALALIKVNIGAFAVLALLFAGVTCDERWRGRPWLRWLVTAAFACSPLLLMASRFNEAWVMRYALTVAFGAAAFAFTATRNPPSKEIIRTRSLVVGAAGTLLLSGAFLLSKTSLRGALDGIIVRPLDQANAFRLPLGLPAYSVAATAVAAIIAVTLRMRVFRFDKLQYAGLTSGIFRLVAGFGIWLSLTFPGDRSPVSFVFGLALSWVAALPPVETATSRERFARVFIVALAVLQSLHAYPVAGSQAAWSVMLFVPVGALCIRDGLFVIRRESLSQRRLGFLGLAGFPVVLLAGVGVLSSLLPQAQNARDLYRTTVALRFPGATRVHVPPSQAETLELLVGQVRRRCSTFVTLPGMNAFYVFAGMEPPTHLNATAWMFLFDSETQQRIVDRVRTSHNVCVIRNRPLAATWSFGRPVPQRPLIRFIDQEFKTVFSRDDYELMVRKERT